eukprot:TRINITY_DN4475_c0_g1_i3.p2 TRINITY_DN4475_c0_g1~~TRINITY_DN4475_c0_g1_i3.p2  ORF type:complete len:128 (+),score=16.47 TRINITY_DN4475_c0_g1_i3:87-470(+)
MIRRPPRSTLSSSSAASDVYKRQVSTQSTGVPDSTNLNPTVPTDCFHHTELALRTIDLHLPRPSSSSRTVQLDLALPAWSFPWNLRTKPLTWPIISRGLPCAKSMAASTLNLRTLASLTASGGSVPR